ncbi:MULTISPECIES: maleylpyruvate isomerase family mycothiol-dependent enzyme [Streptomyces]|uniref:maleylpyruvate isomerase family mycothiol-dependent enzyme n=1 Tax=Streptomyces TaxID=1883 RepID=UPI0016747348|nr:maleylpyruvate isomerase family mycothiol-dependent enzyme [Streptomyces canarius]
MPLLTHDRYCDAIAQQVEQLRAVVTSGADLSATVPTCPDWSLEDLVRHTGGALRWVDALVRTRAQENIPPETVPLGAGPRERGDAAALDRWLADTGDLVVGALREAGPDTGVWAWSGVLNAGFWARRMACEITVHRADATLAAGLPYEVAPDIAADALDEWLQLVEWVQGNTPHEAARDLRGPRRSIHLHATDTDPALNAEWIVDLGEEGMSWRRGHEKATVALRGPLTSVLLAFYRRLPLDAPGLEVLGDREVLEFWLERTSFG